MKLHRSLAEAVVLALQDIFLRNRQADRVVEKLLKSNKKWGSRDRAFIASNTYEIVRWWRLILYCEGAENVTEYDSLWHIFGVWQLLKPVHFQLGSEIELPDWDEFAGIEHGVVLDRYNEARSVRKIFQSIPDWLDEVGERELGRNWDQEIEAMNQEAPLVLRINTLKSDLDTVRQIFGEGETSLVPGVPGAISLKKRQNVTLRDSFKMGYFEVQDSGSQLIAPFLGLLPGLDVIDACAGAGGKSLHIASLMENRGSVLALDTESRKLEELEFRAKRNGATILRTKWIGSDKIIKDLTESADRLLLDVPCSGLGVLRRNPDTKWKLKVKFLDSIRRVQWEILTNYSGMVKVGGKMVYATCSILPSESEDQVGRFIREFGTEWKLLKEHRTRPFEDGFDGFYMALLEKY